MTIETLTQVINENQAAAARGDEVAEFNIDWALSQLIGLQRELGQLTPPKKDEKKG